VTDTGGTRREICGYQAVRAAARDHESYSSDLIGDRDTRDYQQLPLEADPPRHTLFRSAVQPLFMSDAIEPKAPLFEKLAADLIEAIREKGGGDIASDFALPYVIGCLAIIYNRPSDVEEWVSWGPDVWLAAAYADDLVTPESHRAQRERNFDSGTQRSGATLEAYLTRVFAAAKPAPTADPASTDVWDWLSGLEVGGKQLSRAEKFGIANVLLAGGRDTVIKLITGLTWHLIKEPSDRDYLANTPEAFNRTIAEAARFLTPLAKMERVLDSDRSVPLADRDPRRYVVLNYLSANFDTTVWPNPDQFDIHRDRKPHLAFGFGRHSCMGMNITEHETKALLRVLLSNWPNWEFDGEPEIVWVSEGDGDSGLRAIERFDRLRIVVRP